MPAKGFRIDPKQRFMSKVRRDRWGHWRWTGSTNSNGYGLFMMGGRNSGTTAHRAAWLLFVGPIPDKMHVHHICRMRDCVNPDHLLVVTAKKNTIERSLQKGRIDVCKNGHPMTGDNVAWTTWRNGYAARYCRECSRISNRRNYAAHAEARRKYARRRHQQLMTSRVTVAR